MIHRYLWEGYLEEVSHLRHTEENKKWHALDNPSAIEKFVHVSDTYIFLLI
ncbi:hypothetical protein J4P90_11650 [Bacillus sp. SY8(2021)]|uniref:Uncharacterized protein n=1 Tax=Bacillus arachidis TaxID=2819290 RepID=A0ABS3NY81_9BACI|nr:hypothetical protein [Bacillus arachidis]